MAVAVARIGCSGWSYKDWRGPVYPEKAPARTWFAHINNDWYGHAVTDGQDLRAHLSRWAPSMSAV